MAAAISSLIRADQHRRKLPPASMRPANPEGLAAVAEATPGLKLYPHALGLGGFMQPPFEQSAGTICRAY